MFHKNKTNICLKFYLDIIYYISGYEPIIRSTQGKLNTKLERWLTGNFFFFYGLLTRNIYIEIKLKTSICFIFVKPTLKFYLLII